MRRLKVIRSPQKIAGALRRIKLRKKKIGLVPTMGALHEGHLSLIRQARRENDFVAVSIFVNPAQFGPREDFRRYPRRVKKDISLCRREGADFIFLPKAEDMYPAGFATYVNVEGLSNLLCGKSRPGHFRGVATVVTKLFNIVAADTAYFGQKDFQQTAIIKRMVDDLNIPVKIKVLPTVRQDDGLALSSRNAYLSLKERKDALVLPESLKLAADLACSGVRDADKIILAMKKMILKRKRARIDYISIVDCSNLKPVKKIGGKCIILLAAWIGRTRLIDNMIIHNQHA